ncbi:MAG: hypothetical protein WAV51_04775 [Microgenomates group bacterium]
MTVTCIISCAGYTKNISVLQTCIQSLLNAKTATTTLIVAVTTNNARHEIKKNKTINYLVVSPKNAGFVGINNKAIQKTLKRKSNYYLIINDDAWVKSDFFKQLEKQNATLDKKGDVIIPYIYESNKKDLDSFGVEYFKTGYSKNAFSSNITTSLASMSCLLIRTDFLKEMITAYGFFLNPLLKWYLDDVEFSIRALAHGAIFQKCKHIVAYHQRTFTWGRKSYFVMYQSFRNLLWVITLTWPTTIIKKNALRILCWQLLVAMYCLIKYSPFMYAFILRDTINNWGMLMLGRKKILSHYQNPQIFNTIFSSLEVRHARITF